MVNIAIINLGLQKLRKCFHIFSYQLVSALQIINIKKGERNMFENVGDKIKKVAIISFWIVTITSFILAFVFGIEEYYTGWGGCDYEFRAGYFFGFLLGVPLVEYISTLFLIGFGDLIETNREMLKHLSGGKTETVSEELPDL